MIKVKVLGVIILAISFSLWSGANVAASNLSETTGLPTVDRSIALEGSTLDTSRTNVFWQQKGCRSASNSCRRYLPVTITNRNNSTIIAQMPYWSNYPIDRSYDNVKRVVIVVHGSESTAGRTFNRINNMALAANANNTLIIAPRFLTSKTGIVNEPPNVLWWDYRASTGWRRGYNTRNGRLKKLDGSPNFPNSYSSFDVMDHIVSLFDRQKYPSVERIVVAGFSAGGQFVQRYAVATDINDNRVKFIVGACSTYAYISPERQVPRLSGEIISSGFAVPPDCPPGTTNCSKRWKSLFDSCDDSIDSYNDWGYGLNKMEELTYLQNRTVSQIRRTYPQRRVTYIVGKLDKNVRVNQKKDANDNMVPNPLSAQEEGKCAAYVQGKTRYMQALIYKKYLDQYFPGHRHKLIVVNGAIHDSSQVFGSTGGLQELFFD